MNSTITGHMATGHSYSVLCQRDSVESFVKIVYFVERYNILFPSFLVIFFGAADSKSSEYRK